jgi:gliding motility-associated protein GldE
LESTDIEPYSYGLNILLSSVFQPFTFEIAIGLAAMVLLLLMSSLVSGSEVAFFSLTPVQLKELRSKKSSTENVIIQLLERPKRLLATILISNNFINVAIVIISTFITRELFDFTEIPAWIAFMIQVVIVTALILFTGEILPKIYATQQNMQFATFMARPTRILVKLFSPLSVILVKSTNFIDRRLARKSNISMSELSDAIELTTNESTTEEDKRILKGIVKFGDIEVREIMRSRLDVVGVDIAVSFPDLLKIIVDSGFSRIPAYEDSFDNVKGILYIKDLLPYIEKNGGFNWQNLLRDAFFVPENKKINDLLQEFQEKKIHMAIVVDEYGGTSGIVTLEDIIEEIVGEIDDEHDVSTEEKLFIRIDDRHYVFKAKISLNDFCKVLNVDDRIFEEVKGESESLAGLILELLGKLPEQGESVSFLNYTFKIKSVDNRRIKEVILTIQDEERVKERV